jgi:hypothetical protein
VPQTMHSAETANLANRKTKQSFPMSAGRSLAAEGRTAGTGGREAAYSMSGNRTPTAAGRAARADMADAERPSDHCCLDYFATNGAENLTFDLSGVP